MRQFIERLKLEDRSDRWASAMDMLFVLANFIYIEKGARAVPPDWGYSPGLTTIRGEVDPDDLELVELFETCTDADLCRLGRFLHKYTANTRGE